MVVGGNKADSLLEWKMVIGLSTGRASTPKYKVDALIENVIYLQTLQTSPYFYISANGSVLSSSGETDMKSSSSSVRISGW